MLARPYADTVYGSCFSNMKELRIQSKGIPIRAFLLLIQTEKRLFSVRVIKTQMKKGFMSK